MTIKRSRINGWCADIPGRLGTKLISKGSSGFRAFEQLVEAGFAVDVNAVALVQLHHAFLKLFTQASQLEFVDPASTAGGPGDSEGGLRPRGRMRSVNY
jgi:hypothetical protein|tara:strand:- start:842 stop:1138 length:297 start_codon:yes stop_codon:yes gene_type:complete